MTPSQETSFRSLLRLCGKILPWALTAGGLFYAFKGVSFAVLIEHINEARIDLLIVAFILTSCSYLLRSRRWQSLFPERSISFVNAAKVLILGFFINNILPARAGEFIRAHIGGKVSGQTRTLVLATVASERLVDGLTISAMFALFAFGVGDRRMSLNLAYVAWLFLFVGLLVFILIVMRDRVSRFFDGISRKLNHRASDYASNRIRVFLHGLTPIFSRARILPILLFSVLIWTIELLVYCSISEAFNSHLSPAQNVLFLVAVNFSSLIPAAPGGIGVIELVASAALISMGVEKEHALSMVVVQHFIQYIVVGIPGASVMFNWRKMIRQAEAEHHITEANSHSELHVTGNSR